MSAFMFPVISLHPQLLPRPNSTTSLRPLHSPKHTPRLLTPPTCATSTPVKEDLRQKLNNLLTQPTTTTPRTETTRTTPTKIDPSRKYKVLLYNDENHSKDFVVGVLRKCIPELNGKQAWNVMEMAHKTGKGVVGVWIFEISEAYCELLRNNGLRSDIEQE